MKRIIRLTENDLTRIVKRVISEVKSSNEEEHFCEKCYAYGKVNCDECYGEGFIFDPETNEDIPCEKCDGYGKINCDKCDGEGYYYDDYNY